MSAAKVSTALGVGVLVGVAASWLFQSVAAPTPTPVVATPEKVSPGETRTAIDREVSVEHAARVEAERSRDAATHELAQVRERLVVVEKTLAGQAGAPASAAPAATSSAAALDPRTRVRDIEIEADAALRSGEVKKVLALLKELGSLGKDAWPLATKLSVSAYAAIAQNPKQEQADWIELMGSVSAGDLKDLQTEALLHPESYPAEYRHIAVNYHWMNDPNTGALYVKQLATEPDATVGMSMAMMLGMYSKPEHVSGLADSLRAQQKPEIRAAIANALAATPGDEATQSLGAIAASGSDPDLRRAATLALESRRPAVAGFFLTYVPADSALVAAGLHEGDILTRLNGVPMTSMQDFGRAYQGAKPDSPIPVKVFRGGAMTESTLTLAQLGSLYQSGRFVAPE